MEIAYQLLFLAMIFFVGYRVYLFAKRDPKQFSAEYINKSIGTLGFVAIGLIVFLAFVISMLRS